MAKSYQVVGACVTNVPVAGAQGTQLATFYAGQPLPEGVPADRIAHLLSVDLIKEVGGDAKPAGATPAPAPVSAPGGDQVGQVPESVNGRSSKADLVAYGAAKGGDRAALDQLTRDELLDRYVRNPQ